MPKSTKPESTSMLFGVLASAAVATLLAQGSALAQGAAATTAKASKCVHDCAGYAACKTATNACKGKNDCAGQGLVPKECSSQTTQDSCKKVVDAKKKTMCTWQPG